MRMRTAGGAGLVLLCVWLVCLAAPARGATPGAFSETYGDWDVICVSAAQTSADVGRQCLMQQRIAWRGGEAEQLRNLLTVTLSAPRPGGELDIAMLVPFGLLLDAGAKLRVDKSKTLHSLRFLTCLPGEGCFLRGRLSAEATKAMEKGLVFVVEMATRENQPFTVEMSLKGFTDAFARLKEAAVP